MEKMGLPETWKLWPPPKLQYRPGMAWVTAVASALQTVLGEKERPQGAEAMTQSRKNQRWSLRWNSCPLMIRAVQLMPGEAEIYGRCVWGIFTVCRRGKESVTQDKEKGCMNECSEVVQKSRTAISFPIFYLVLFFNQSSLHASYSCVIKTNLEHAFACANIFNWEYVKYTLSQASEDRNLVPRHSVKATEKALSKSNREKKTWTEKIIWESPKCQQL